MALSCSDSVEVVDAGFAAPAHGIDCTKSSCSTNWWANQDAIVKLAATSLFGKFGEVHVVTIVGSVIARIYGLALIWSIVRIRAEIVPINIGLFAGLLVWFGDEGMSFEALIGRYAGFNMLKNVFSDLAAFISLLWLAVDEIISPGIVTDVGVRFGVVGIFSHALFGRDGDFNRFFIGFIDGLAIISSTVFPAEIVPNFPFVVAGLEFWFLVVVVVVGIDSEALFEIGDSQLWGINSDLGINVLSVIAIIVPVGAAELVPIIPGIVAGLRLWLKIDSI